jgi:hypothetical protein
METLFPTAGSTFLVSLSAGDLHHHGACNVNKLYCRLMFMNGTEEPLHLGCESGLAPGCHLHITLNPITRPQPSKTH